MCQLSLSRCRVLQLLYETLSDSLERYQVQLLEYKLWDKLAKIKFSRPFTCTKSCEFNHMAHFKCIIKCYSRLNEY